MIILEWFCRIYLALFWVLVLVMAVTLYGSAWLIFPQLRSL